MTPIIRPEAVADYPAVADLIAHAFGNRWHAASVVALLRQRVAFDPKLSLVAEKDGQVVGHILFFPYTLRLLGANVPAVGLAPLAVAPAHQGIGIGAALVEEGHRLAAARGFALSFLLGHVSYYPRFGYRTGAYGSFEVVVSARRPSGVDLEARDPQQNDGPHLRELSLVDEADVDFTLDPGTSLLDWISPNPAIAAQVYLEHDAIVGYTRVHQSQPAKASVFLARDPAAARAVAHTLAKHAGMEELTLPIHPGSVSAGAFAAPIGRPWEAAMAVALAPSPLDDYFRSIEQGARPPGRVTWPVAFDLA